MNIADGFILKMILLICERDEQLYIRPKQSQRLVHQNSLCLQWIIHDIIGNLVTFVGPKIVTTIYKKMIIIICCLYCEHTKFISSYWTINIVKQINLSNINRVILRFIVYKQHIILSCQRYWNFQPDVVIKVCHTYDPLTLVRQKIDKLE